MSVQLQLHREGGTWGSCGYLSGILTRT
uniref:Uncharacterized protein n=1 Tax=Anguilla anguilla TaxID=7936 RepID=A0A0E9UL75_ANGAN